MGWNTPSEEGRQMSKLNVYHHELRHNEYAKFYLKYEADKVIAELKKKLTEAHNAEG